MNVDFIEAMKTIRRMHETCACGPISQEKTGKPMCPLYATAFPCDKITTLYTDDSDIGNRIVEWAKENPEPVYPTWEDWLLEIGVISKGMNWSDLNIPLRKPIPADIAQKLGIRPKPKEG